MAIHARIPASSAPAASPHRIIVAAVRIIAAAGILTLACWLILTLGIWHAIQVLVLLVILAGVIFAIAKTAPAIFRETDQ